ncbi:MAG: DUF1801 domain-containing protein [Chloroflexota bacterium]|nr:MAG: DUF1801 domain-containing protein [Chloroflexota bacterium]
MISVHELEEHFRYLPPEQLDIVVEIHNLVARVAPGALEVLRREGLVYYDAHRGGPVSAGICQTLVQPDQIRLAFNLGAFLPDPHGLLEGNLIAKRFARIVSYEDAPWDDLAALIQASASFDPRTLAK